MVSFAIGGFAVAVSIGRIIGDQVPESCKDTVSGFQLLEDSILISISFGFCRYLYKNVRIGLQEVICQVVDTVRALRMHAFHQVPFLEQEIYEFVLLDILHLGCIMLYDKLLLI